ncbi:interferon lambda receptor 1 isoform X2 [Vanacampus margaritifer]
MWCVKVLILLLFCYACLSVGDDKVYFCSKNFYNVLHWNASEPSVPDQQVLYSVQYRRCDEEEPYHIKSECQNITALQCDLTAETPLLPLVYYQARVYADGRLHGRTFRFEPIVDTTLGQANLSTGVTPTSLHVSARLPLGPNGDSLEDIIKKSKSSSVKNCINFTFYLTSPKWAMQEHPSPSAHFVFNLKSNQRYCGYVVYTNLCHFARPQSEKADFCETLPAKPSYPGKILWWALTGAALLAIIVMVLVGAVCVYMKGGLTKKLPRSLEMHIARELPGFQKTPERNLIIRRPKVSAQNEQIPISPTSNGPCVGPVGSYFPKDLPCQPGLGTTGSSVGRPTVQASSNQSSVVYSSLATAVPTEQNQLPRVLVEDGDGPPSPQSLDKEACGQLQLRTARDANGQLELSVAFRVKSGTERKPLLSDLYESEEEASVLGLLKRLNSSESSDSGCVDGTLIATDCARAKSAPLGNYISNNVPPSEANPVSGYKQNWMPFDATPNNDQDYMRRNHSWTFAGPRETEDGEFNDDAGFQRKVLQDWVLQIQE